MFTYFKPLRRKIGIVTLFLTIVCVDGWINSFHGAHVFRHLTRKHGAWQIVSMHGNLQIEYLQSNSEARDQYGTYSTFRLKLPYTTITVPLIVATGFLLLPKVRERKSPLSAARDSQS